MTSNTYSTLTSSNLHISKFLNLAFLLGLTFSFSSCSGTSKNLPIPSKGSIERHQLESKYVTSRPIDVWLPEGFNRDEKYAVLYMHDGQMLYDASTTWNKQEWGVDEVMSDLLKKDKIRKTIVVGIWNTDFRHSEYFPQKPFESLDKVLQDSLINEGLRNNEDKLFKSPISSDNYLKFIVEELKPYIDEAYPTFSDVQNTFIAGSSMGGLISMYALCEYPSVFSGAACLSTHWLGTFDTINNPIPYAFIKYLGDNIILDSGHKIYFDHGTETLDAHYGSYQALVKSIFKNRQYDQAYWRALKFEGEDHSENAWRKRLHTPLEFLLE